MASLEDREYYEPNGTYPITETFLFPFNYNFMLVHISMINQIMCVWFGGWGLFWYADMGEMIQRCFETGLQGGSARFIHKADYSDEE